MKTYYLFSLCLAFSFSITAQTFKKRTPEEKAKYYTDEMAKDIVLEKGQAEKIYDINLIVSQQFDSLFTSKPESEVKRKGSIAIYRQRDAAFRKVLSNPQFLKYDDLQREKREQKMKSRLEKVKSDSDEAKVEKVK
jgi:hypothetical protein